MNKLKKIIQEVLNEHKDNVSSDIKKGFQAISHGMSEAPLRRAGALLLQGRWDEAEQFLSRYLKPEYLPKVIEYYKKTITPINFSTEKILKSPEVNSWLEKFIPAINQYRK